ncbi:MAG: PRC-barrel domain containing protein [Hyphomicrobiaceae bacterium]|nr:MAG: PRC-barrel domain containing protein [Hyphomicrobiaceae bacterium]
MKLTHAALLAVGIATTNPASAEIDASQADARLIGMSIFTSDGLLIGQVTGIEFFSSNRCLVAAIGGLMGFGPRSVCIPLNWANKEEDYVQLLLTNEQIPAFLLAPGRG